MSNNNLILILKILDLVALGYEHYLRSKPQIDELRAKIQKWIETGTEPTDAEFAELNARIDAKLIELMEKAESAS